MLLVYRTPQNDKSYRKSTEEISVISVSQKFNAYPFIMSYHQRFHIFNWQMLRDNRKKYDILFFYYLINNIKSVIWYQFFNIQEEFGSNNLTHLSLLLNHFHILNSIGWWTVAINLCKDIVLMYLTLILIFLFIWNCKNLCNFI